jgi:hypothetical protein
MDHRNGSSSPLAATDIWLALLIGFAALALYIRTLAPSLLWGDSAEFQTLSYTLGMTHPTGYATQIIFGKIFTLIPIHNIAWRVNLMSAFFGALAVAETFLIVRLLVNARVAALSASLTLMLTEGFWWRALVAESYAPAAGMLAGVWLFFLLWRKTDKPIFLFLSGLTGGLSLGIHSTVVMSAAAVLAVMAFTARKRMEWGSAAVGALLGVALFLGFFFFLDFNDPPSSVYNAVFRTNLSTLGLTPADYDTPLERFMNIFPAGRFWTYYFTAAPRETQARLVEYLTYFPAWGLALTLLGAVHLMFGGRWREGMYPIIAFLIIWGFAVTVAFSIYREFYVPVAVITSVWFGAGAGAMLEGVGKLPALNQASRGGMRAVIPAALIVLPILISRQNLSLAIQHGYTNFIRDNHIYPVFAPDKAIRDAKRIINKVEPNAIVFSDWDKLYSYIYTAQIEEGMTTLTFREAWIGDDQTLSQTTLEYIEANIDNRPIYFTVEMPGLEEQFRVTRINETLLRIERK